MEKTIRTEKKKADTKTPSYLLPAKLRMAYESGDDTVIIGAEKDIRDFVAQGDHRLIFATYFTYKEKAKACRCDKESSDYRMQSFIAETCKNVLIKGYGVPKQAFRSVKTRLELANETVDPNVLDLLVHDRDLGVMAAAVNNQNTSEETLRYIMENGGMYSRREAEKVLNSKKENV